MGVCLFWLFSEENRILSNKLIMIAAFSGPEYDSQSQTRGIVLEEQSYADAMP